jgi:HlyD family secretion protein
MKLVLTSTAITAVVAMGFLIDVQSQPLESAHSEDQSQYRIYAPGRIEGAAPDVDLRPQLVGRIVEVLVRDGQQVEAGQLLLRLEDAQFRHEVELADAELDAAIAQKERLLNGAREEERSEANALYRATVTELEQAQKKWERFQKLSVTQAIAQQEVDDQQSLIRTLRARADAAKARADFLAAAPRHDDISLADAKIAMARARLQLAQSQLEKTRLIAPTTSRVMRVNVEPGELTGPSVSEPPIILVDNRIFQVRAFIEELDAPRVSIDMLARITADGIPNRELTGRVTRLSPHMTRKEVFSDRPSERLDTKVREVWIELPNVNNLVIGLPVDVTIDPQANSLE